MFNTLWVYVYVRRCACVYSPELFLKNTFCWFVGFNESSVMSSSLWKNTDCFILHAATIVLLLFEKNLSSGMSSIKPWSLLLSTGALSFPLRWKPAPCSSAVQGSNSKQGQLDYSLWGEAAYFIWNTYCSVNSYFLSYNVSLQKQALCSLLKVCQDAFWKTSGSFWKSNQSIELVRLQSFYLHPSKTGGWLGHGALSEKQEPIH